MNRIRPHSVSLILILAILFVPFHGCATTSPRAPSGGTDLTEADIGHDLHVVTNDRDRYLGKLVQFDDVEIRLRQGEVMIIIDRSEVNKMEVREPVSDAEVARDLAMILFVGVAAAALVLGTGLIYLLQ